MDKQQNFKLPLVILIVCVCLGSLAFLPLTGFVGMPALEVLEIDIDQTEFEENLFIVTLAVPTVAGLDTIEPGSMNLGFPPAGLSPVSPPPKHS